MTVISKLAVFGLMAVAMAGQGVAATTYTLSQLTAPARGGYLDIGTTAINEKGQIAGIGYLEGGGLNALVWDGGTAIRIQPVGSLSSVANGINESGLVIGTATYEGGVTRAFTYDLATVTFGDPFGAGSSGYGVNDSGQLVGALGNAPVLLDPVNGLTTYALPGNIESASFRAIMNNGAIVGARTRVPGFEASQNRDLFTLSSPAGSVPGTPLDQVRNLDFVAANNAGQYAANFTFPGSPFFINFVGVFNLDGTPNPAGLGILPFDQANYGGGFNDALDFVGESYSENRYGGGYGDAIITTISGGTALLSSLVTNLDGAFLQQGKLINNSGTIVAFGFLGNRRATFVLTPNNVGAPGVPEPASWALLIAGFGLVGAMQRRRRTVSGAYRPSAPSAAPDALRHA